MGDGGHAWLASANRSLVATRLIHGSEAHRYLLRMLAMAVPRRPGSDCWKPPEACRTC
jgi:hypothetical protein